MGTKRLSPVLFLQIFSLSIAKFANQITALDILHQFQDTRRLLRVLAARLELHHFLVIQVRIIHGSEFLRVGTPFFEHFGRDQSTCNNGFQKLTSSIMRGAQSPTPQ
jgi:hypothetical protein